MTHPHLHATGSTPGLDQVGAKACRILDLLARGWSVPPAVAISVDAYRLHLASRPEDISPREWILHQPLDPDLESSLLSCLPVDFGRGYAVRSSAIGEDGGRNSHAGQFLTELDVPREGIGEAIRKVWASAHSERSGAYRKASGLADEVQMGVLLQPVVPADCSGVALGLDPVGGSRRTVSIAATPGLGEGLVSGQVDAEELRVRKDQVERVRSAGEGRILEDGHALEIARAVRDAESVFGPHQDIEWCRQGDRLWILQARPATALGHTPDQDGNRRLWESANIVESYPGVSSPLTFSFAQDVYRKVYQEFCRILGVEEESIAGNPEIFQMLGSLRGRIHYDLANWYKVLSLLPGYDLNARFMEQMMGARESFSPPLGLRRSRRHPWLRVLSTTAGLLRAAIGLRRSRDEFRSRVGREMDRFHGLDLCSLSPQELVDLYRHLERELLERWRAPLVNDFFAMIVHGLLRKELSGLSPEGERIGNALLAGQGGIESEIAIQELSSIAKICKVHPHLASVLRAEPSAFLERARSVPEIATRMDAYLRRFGERCPAELKLESIPPALDPTLLAANIQSLLQAPPVDVAAGPSLRRLAQEELDGLLGKRFLRGFWVRWLVERTRRRVADRENLRLERTRAFGAVRRIFLALGTNFCREGRISSPRDVFFLTIQEVFDFVEGRCVTEDLAALVELRRELHRKNQSAPLPGERLATRGMAGLCLFDTSTAQAGSPAQEGELQGLGCSSGTVRGLVRIVTDPNAPGDLADRILVAERTDPGWTPLFPLAKGILVERGSLLSHSAIVAREMGIPAVVAIPGLLANLADGDEVELDGSSGRISLKNRAEERT